MSDNAETFKAVLRITRGSTHADADRVVRELRELLNSEPSAPEVPPASPKGKDRGTTDAPTRASK